MRQFLPLMLFGLAAITPPSAAFAAGQSPIDITAENTRFAVLPPLQFDYAADTTLSLINTGSPGEEATVRADVGPGAGSLLIGTSGFDLLQFHFHTEAEHEINGLRSAMELHFVHRAANGTLAVVGRLIEEGAENAILSPLFDNLPGTPGAIQSISNFNLAGLLPTSLDSFRYTGSLTTFPYTEGVLWNVLASPLTLSAAQIGSFRALFPDGDSREVQDLAGRIILTDVVGFAATVPEPDAWALLVVGFGLIGVTMRARGRQPATALALRFARVG